MTKSYKKYTEYKDSGVDWLGEIPSHWEVKKSKFIWQENINLSDSEEEQLLSVSQYTGVNISKNESRGTSLMGYKRVEKDNLVINIMLAWLGGLGLSAECGIVSPAYSVYKLKENHNAKYLHYLYRTKLYLDEFARKSKGVVPSRWRMYTEDFGQVFTTLPPLSEQQKIADFLDKKTSDIDKAITQKEQLIDLLKERKQILINKAVTRGLNPRVQLKDSEIDWIGEIPEHWEVRKLKYCVEMLVSNVDKHTKITEHPVRLCNYVDVYKNDRITAELDFMEATASIDEIKRFSIQIDDVIITKDSEDWLDIGVPSWVNHQQENLICAYHLAILRPYKGMIAGGYLFRALLCPPIKTQFNVQANGVTRYGISHGVISSIFIPLPPLTEQIEISNYIEEHSAKIDMAITKKQQEIEALKEYKATLIDSAVRGRIRIN